MGGFFRRLLGKKGKKIVPEPVSEFDASLRRLAENHFKDPKTKFNAIVNLGLREGVSEEEFVKAYITDYKKTSGQK